MKILVIDDERDFADALAKSLRALGEEADYACTGAEGLQKAKASVPDAVLLDLNMPDLSGLDLLPDLRSHAPGVSVIMITGQASHKSAVQAMKLGAEDYLEKPVDLDELRLVLGRLGRKAALGKELAAQKRRRIEDFESEFLFMSDPAMKKAYADLEEVAPRSQVTVLIQGETGTGKEHVARLLHLFSERSSGPFVSLHCAALPETLLESELFGYEAGAFTGATARKPGLFEQAQGGTLFLDEIGELPPLMQVKLLKVLEEKSMRRLGGLQAIKLDVRLVAATNRDLAAESAAGRFRQDLYYRLNVFNIALPPLRKRPSDIPLLARFFFERSCAAFGKRLEPLDEAALEGLKRHPWPGNVRELKNFVERLVLQAKGGRVEAAELALALPEAPGREPAQDISRELLERALEEAKGDKSQAALKLGVSRPTLYRHLKKHGLPL